MHLVPPRLRLRRAEPDVASKAKESTPVAAVAPTGITPLWRWGICGLLFLATLLNYLDRQTLSIGAPLIRAEFNLTNAQMGALFSAFFYTYAAMQLIGGWLLDRIEIRRAYAAAVTLWSLATALTCTVQRTWQLFACRMLLGTFEAANWPAAARIIVSITAPKERSLANGIFTRGASVGALVAPLGLVWLFQAAGWRAGFLVVGSLGILWAPLWLLWTRGGRERLAGTMPEPAGEQMAVDVPWSHILRSRHFYAILLASALSDAYMHFYSSWITLYLTQTYQLSFDARLSVLLMFVYGALGLGYLTGGAAVLPLARRGMDAKSARRIVMTGATALMCAAPVIPYVQSPIAATVLLCLLTFGRGAWGANFFTFTQEISREKIARLTAISGAIGSLAGAVFVWLVGIMADSMGFHGVFWLLGAMSLTATVPLLFIRWRPLAAPSTTRPLSP